MDSQILAREGEEEGREILNKRHGREQRRVRVRLYGAFATFLYLVDWCLLATCVHVYKAEMLLEKPAGEQETNHPDRCSLFDLALRNTQPTSLLPDKDTHAAHLLKRCLKQ